MTHQHQNTIRSTISKAKRNKSVFGYVESVLRLNRILKNGLPAHQIPKLIFVACLLVIYIANAHYADKLVRKTAKLKIEVEDLRADYITTKADLMYKSKQSEVAKRVAPFGLRETLTPPTKILIREDDRY
ncbi:MAG: FtsL-like putative cell division protein [Cytophagaceae bacterium]|nr:FtsL-like putative cell division protein [Cytophagaceae bacterium]MDW8455425.1 FtsL-like putative cell division protein [Cytophagaceae bacterium]